VDITDGPGEPSAGQMELDLLQEWGCLEGVSAYTIAIRHGGILEAERVMKDPTLARKYFGDYSEADAALVLRREAMRYLTLRHLYEQALAEGTANVLRQHAGVREATKIEDDKEWEAVCDYLDFEGLADLRVNTLIGITPAGMAEVERAVDEPDAPTEHFSLVVIQQFNAPVGAVVTGDGATVNVTQIIGGVKAEEDDH
ncbi:MAG: hypothetical protein ACRD68_15770, partial [Pyrinomonadaceae bacterium]